MKTLATLLLLATTGCGVGEIYRCVTGSDQCGGDHTPRPHQESAILLIEGYVDYWIAPVPAHDEMPTSIAWLVDSWCTTPDGLDVPGFYLGEACVGGVYWGGGHITLPEVEHLSDGGLAHEMLHRIRGALGMDLDGGHVEAAWWHEVPRIQAALAAKGW